MDIELEEFYTFPTRVKIASILRKAIFSGDIKAGEELSLTDISNKLNVSRTPVREAFQIFLKIIMKLEFYWKRKLLRKLLIME